MHARHRARPAGLSAAQSAVLDAVRVSSHPRLWWGGDAGHAVSTDPADTRLRLRVNRAVAPRHDADLDCYHLPPSQRVFSGRALELAGGLHVTHSPGLM